MAVFLAVGAGFAIGGRVGLAFPCPFRSLTGWLCPLCGTTHLALALASGDVVAAFRANQLVLLALVVVACCSVRWVWQVLTWPRGVERGAVRWRVTQRSVYMAAAVVAVLWTLARNLVPELRA